jgi:hypothetical protein
MTYIGQVWQWMQIVHKRISVCTCVSPPPDWRQSGPTLGQYHGVQLLYRHMQQLAVEEDEHLLRAHRTQQSGYGRELETHAQLCAVPSVFCHAPQAVAGETCLSCHEDAGMHDMAKEDGGKAGTHQLVLDAGHDLCAVGLQIPSMQVNVSPGWYILLCTVHWAGIGRLGTMQHVSNCRHCLYVEPSSRPQHICCTMRLSVSQQYGAGVQLPGAVAAMHTHVEVGGEEGAWVEREDDLRQVGSCRDYKQQLH